MTKEEQLSIINDAIQNAKYNLKPLGFNFIFWGVLIISMSSFLVNKTSCTYVNEIFIGIERLYS